MYRQFLLDVRFQRACAKKARHDVNNGVRVLKVEQVQAGEARKRHFILGHLIHVEPNHSSPQHLPHQVYHERERNDVMSYAAFTQAEGGTWPEWKSIPDSSAALSPPSGNTIESYCNHKHEDVRLEITYFLHRYLAEHSSVV